MPDRAVCLECGYKYPAEQVRRYFVVRDGGDEYPDTPLCNGCADEYRDDDDVESIEEEAAEESPQPRALVALSDDRQWLVVLLPNVHQEHGQFAVLRCVFTGDYKIEETFVDTGQDAHEVLAAWLGGARCLTGGPSIEGCVSGARAQARSTTPCVVQRDSGCTLGRQSGMSGEVRISAWDWEGWRFTVAIEPMPDRAVVDDRRELCPQRVGIDGSWHHWSLPHEDGKRRCLDCGIVQPDLQPRALVALSDDRQWLVVLAPEPESEWHFVRWINGESSFWDHDEFWQDEGQDAHQVLAEWLREKGSE